jgi:hypothetical protein
MTEIKNISAKALYIHSHIRLILTVTLETKSIAAWWTTLGY